jgi:hypothetical protein
MGLPPRLTRTQIKSCGLDSGLLTPIVSSRNETSHLGERCTLLMATLMDMRRLLRRRVAQGALSLFGIFFGCASPRMMVTACAQSSGSPEWATDSFDAQRDGWQRNETAISLANAKNLQLLWKLKTDNKTMGMQSFREPLIIAGVQTATGDKTLAIVAGSANDVSFSSPPQGGLWGVAGPAIGSDGTIYFESGDHPYDAKAGLLSTSFQAYTFSEDVLKLKDYYTPSNYEWLTKRDLDMDTTPVVFPYERRDVIVGGGKEGRFFLLDSKSLGGADHETPLLRSDLISNANINFQTQGTWGSLAAWKDKSGTQWRTDHRQVSVQLRAHSQRRHPGIQGGNEGWTGDSRSRLAVARHGDRRAAHGRQWCGVRVSRWRIYRAGKRCRGRSVHRRAKNTAFDPSKALCARRPDRQGTVFQRRPDYVLPAPVRSCGCRWPRSLRHVSSTGVCWSRMSGLSSAMTSTTWSAC